MAAIINIFTYVLLAGQACSIVLRQKHAAAKEPLIIMFGNDDYRTAIVNQMVAFRHLGITNYDIICIDQKLTDFMESIGRPCRRVEVPTCDKKAEEGESVDTSVSFRQKRWPGKNGKEWSGCQKDFWRARLNLVTEVLGNGTDVILTDSDAVWLKNPMSLMQDADIVSQRGSFPNNVGFTLGATAVMGFIRLASNPAVIDFMKNEVMPRYVNDDQVAFNDALLQNGINFGKRLEYEGSEQIDTGVLPAKGERRGLTVKLLDHSRFPRRCNALGDLHDGVVVAHCLAGGKRGVDKVKEFKKFDHKLWNLKANWQELPIAGDTDTYLQSVGQDLDNKFRQTGPEVMLARIRSRESAKKE